MRKSDFRDPTPSHKTILSFRLDIYRRQARNLAWYDEEGEASSHNPFKKFRRSPRRSNSVQLESRLPGHRSLDIRTSEDTRRRLDMNNGLGGPEYAGTFPPESAGSDQGTPKSPPEPSMESHDPINVSRGIDESLDSASTKPRMRKGFLGKFGHSNEVDELEDKKSMSGTQKFTFASQLRATVLNSWINVLLVAAPVGIALYAVDANPIAVFVVNFIAIIPLAAMLSFATEEIALRTGETIGGLLNASFGNAVELIISIIALVQRKVLIVQTSLIGSMLSNLLLVMGMCFFFGGIDRMEQHFNVTVAQTAASLLALAVSSLIIPTAFHKWSDASNGDQTAPLSRGTSVLLLIVYGCYLFFQLKSHAEMYNRPSPKVERRRARVGEGDASRGIAQIGKMTAAPMVGQSRDHMQMEDPEDEPEEPQLSIFTAVLTLAISTGFVAACAEFMVSRHLDLPGLFLLRHVLTRPRSLPSTR
jgi:Ca2+:H+ antiporter